MTFYPYSRVKSENLKPLLLTSRFLGFLGYLFILVSIGLLIFSIFAGPQIVSGDPNGPIVSMSVPGYRDVVWYFSLISFSSGLVCSVFGGLCAAVVSCEHKYTQG